MESCFRARTALQFAQIHMFSRFFALLLMLLFLVIFAAVFSYFTSFFFYCLILQSVRWNRWEVRMSKALTRLHDKSITLNLFNMHFIVKQINIMLIMHGSFEHRFNNSAMLLAGNVLMTRHNNTRTHMK